MPALRGPGHGVDIDLNQLLNVNLAEFPANGYYWERYRDAHRLSTSTWTSRNRSLGTDEGSHQTLAALLSFRRRYPTPPALSFRSVGECA